MIRFLFLLSSLICSYSFSDSNYRNELENFAQKLVFDKYNSQNELNNNEKLDLQVAPLDNRLNYPQCQTELIGEIVNDSIKRNTSVKISCLDETPWTNYLRVRVNVLQKTAVVTTGVSKGQTLNQDNVTAVYMDKTLIRNGGFISPESLYGTRLKRNLSADKVIRDRDVCFVCKDDKVSIYATNVGLSIKASGIALSDANIGGTVRVKNSRTQRIIVATVTGLKEVKVSF
ncbi:flagella basal body P-ring formation protein FlgA [Psychromonas marina]|uniref:Flagella basal body P-ring formation protein FlgA n=1 Tax=Psychromonas marina TaxID=88364 RepID=A0ABQ6DX36_9GAMM|nr:flagellar basal body P-ring formation chaperone FlgA [Psychromonas marina]GLS89296.1 flagella basal body P-ring formation protein FlgA [Psychromonas marina]